MKLKYFVTFFLFLMIGWGLSSSAENARLVGSKLTPGTVARARSESGTLNFMSVSCLHMSGGVTELLISHLICELWYLWCCQQSTVNICINLNLAHLYVSWRTWCWIIAVSACTMISSSYTMMLMLLLRPAWLMVEHLHGQLLVPDLRSKEGCLRCRTSPDLLFIMHWWLKLWNNFSFFMQGSNLSKYLMQVLWPLTTITIESVHKKLSWRLLFWWLETTADCWLSETNSRLLREAHVWKLQPYVS